MLVSKHWQCMIIAYIRDDTRRLSVHFYISSAGCLGCDLATGNVSRIYSCDLLELCWLYRMVHLCVTILMLRLRWHTPNLCVLITLSLRIPQFLSLSPVWPSCILFSRDATNHLCWRSMAKSIRSVLETFVVMMPTSGSGDVISQIPLTLLSSTAS